MILGPKALMGNLEKASRQLRWPHHQWLRHRLSTSLEPWLRGRSGPVDFWKGTRGNGRGGLTPGHPILANHSNFDIAKSNANSKVVQDQHRRIRGAQSGGGGVSVARAGQRSGACQVGTMPHPSSHETSVSTPNDGCQVKRQSSTWDFPLEGVVSPPVSILRLGRVAFAGLTSPTRQPAVLLLRVAGKMGMMVAPPFHNQCAVCHSRVHEKLDVR